MATLMWPRDVLKFTNDALNPAFRNTRGGAAVAYGQADITASDAGYWVATFPVAIYDQNHRKAIRALQVLLEGGLTPINIPLTRRDQPVPAAAIIDGLYDEVEFDDDEFFSDGTGLIGRVIDVTLDADAAARATQISVTINYADELEPPNHFSFGDRLYRIKSISTQDETSATFRIWPPLREAVTAGEQLNFDTPRCRMRLANDQALNVDLEALRFDKPTVTFVEDL